MIRSLRDEAMLILQGRGAILKTAREVTCILRASGIDGAVIGGVAVVLHGHVRTTVDVDLFVPERTKLLADALQRAGFTFDPKRREFSKEGVALHLVTGQHVKLTPLEYIEVDGVQTVALPSLINMKLQSGLRDPLRAQDLADVIGLIRCHRLSSAFAAKLAKPVRAEFRKLARAIAKADSSLG